MIDTPYRVYARLDHRWIVWAGFHMESDFNRYWDQLMARCDSGELAKHDQYGIPYYYRRGPSGQHPARVHSRPPVAFA